jgi:hypothetical protein
MRQGVVVEWTRDGVSTEDDQASDGVAKGRQGPPRPLRPANARVPLRDTRAYLTSKQILVALGGV